MHSLESVHSFATTIKRNSKQIITSGSNSPWRCIYTYNVVQYVASKTEEKSFVTAGYHSIIVDSYRYWVSLRLHTWNNIICRIQWKIKPTIPLYTTFPGFFALLSTCVEDVVTHRCDTLSLSTAGFRQEPSASTDWDLFENWQTGSFCPSLFPVYRTSKEISYEHEVVTTIAH